MTKQEFVEMQQRLLIAEQAIAFILRRGPDARPASARAQPLVDVNEVLKENQRVTLKQLCDENNVWFEVEIYEPEHRD